MKTTHPFKTILIIATLAASSAANAAQSGNPPYDEGALAQFGVTPSLLFLFDEFCERDSDVISCSYGLVTLGVQVDATYRFPFKWFAIGVVGGLDFELNQTETCSSESGCSELESMRLWRIAAEARFYPLLRKRIGLWLAVEGGVVGAAGRAISDVAPETGGGIGFDIPIGRHFLIGAEARGLFFGFGKAPTTPPDGGNVQLTNAFWTTVGLLKIGARFSL